MKTKQIKFFNLFFGSITGDALGAPLEFQERGDSDTIACVCGQISGAFYGFDNIPQEWLNHLHLYNLIFDMTKNLYLNSLKNNE